MLSKAIEMAKVSVRKCQHVIDNSRLFKERQFENVKTVHLSIDDVHVAFAECCTDHLESIFEQKLFSDLKELHEKYQSTFSLYCFYDPDYMLPTKYCEELQQNDWLRIGYHADLNGMVTIEGYNKFTCYYRQQNVSLASSLRLHEFKTPQALLPQLLQDGVDTLLCSDDDGRESYGVGLQQNRGGYLH